MSRRAGGRIDGQRHAASPVYVPFGSAPVGARIAGGKIAGVRHAALSPNVIPPSNPLRIAAGKVGGVRYAGRGFGTQVVQPDLVFIIPMTVVNITATTFDVRARVNADAISSLLIRPIGSTQPSDAEFDASAEKQTVFNSSLFTMNHVGEPGGILVRAWLQVVSGSQRLTDSKPVLIPQVGFQTVVIANLNDPLRITTTSGAIADIRIGETVSWGNIAGAGTVNVNDDATFDVAANAVKHFDVFVGNTTIGWRAFDTQFVLDSQSHMFVAGPF